MTMPNWLFGILLKRGFFFREKLARWSTIYVAMHGRGAITLAKKSENIQNAHAVPLEMTTKIWTPKPRQIKCLAGSCIKSSSCVEANEFALLRSKLRDEKTNKNLPVFERLDSYADLRLEVQFYRRIKP